MPNEYTSEYFSTASPFTCSCAMYAGVPTTLPLEVRSHRLAVVGDEDVVGLEVTGNDAEVGRDAAGGKQLLPQDDRHVDAEPPVLTEPRTHRAPVDPLHDDEKDGAVLVEVVDGRS